MPCLTCLRKCEILAGKIGCRLDIILELMYNIYEEIDNITTTYAVRRTAAITLWPDGSHPSHGKSAPDNARSRFAGQGNGS